MHALQRRGMLLISLRIVSRSISCQNLNQGVDELLDWPGWVWKPRNALIHGMLDVVQAQRTCWPVNCVNALILWKSLAHSCHMRSGMVVFQEKPRTDWTNVAPPNNRSKDLVSVPWTYQVTTIKHMQVRTPSMEMPPQSITDPPPYLLCWTMLHAWPGMPNNIPMCFSRPYASVGST